MQITFKTRRGTVELSLRKLNLFRRVRVLEDKEETLLRRVEKLEKVAGACPYRNRAEEPAETSPAYPVELGAGEDYTSSDLFTEWTEGEDVAKQRREERRQMSEEKAKRGGSGA